MSILPIQGLRETRVAGVTKVTKVTKATKVTGRRTTHLIKNPGFQPPFYQTRHTQDMEKSRFGSSRHYTILSAAIAAIAISAFMLAPHIADASMDDFLDRLWTDDERNADKAAGSWRLGDNLESGDSFAYRICNSIHAVEFTHPHDCYDVRMDFIYRSVHHAYGNAGISGGLIWIVDASFTSADGERDRRTILFVDEQHRVYPTSTHDRGLAASVEATLMHLSIYGEQNLSVGSHWGDIKTHFTAVPLSVISWDGSSTATLGYDTGEHESRTIIHDSSPFPIYSKWFEPNDALPSEPRLLHEYVMLGRE